MDVPLAAHVFLCGLYETDPTYIEDLACRGSAC